MLFVEVECANALFESQKGLIDFSAINFRLLISVHSIGSPLTTRQIYEANLTVESAVVLEDHLHDGVRAGAFRVCTSGAACSQRHSNLQCLHDRFDVVNLYFCQIDNVYLLLSIFSTVDWRSVVEQVEEFSAINLVEGQVQLQVRVHVQILDDVVARQKV